MIHLQAFAAFCYSYQQRGRDSNSIFSGLIWFDMFLTGLSTDDYEI